MKPWTLWTFGCRKISLSLSLSLSLSITVTSQARERQACACVWYLVCLVHRDKVHSECWAAYGTVRDRMAGSTFSCSLESKLCLAEVSLLMDRLALPEHLPEGWEGSLTWQRCCLQPDKAWRE